jgi:hypothetical protein
MNTHLVSVCKFLSRQAARGQFSQILRWAIMPHCLPAFQLSSLSLGEGLHVLEIEMV